MYIFGNEISEPVYFRHHYLDMYILGNEKLLDVYFRYKPPFGFVFGAPIYIWKALIDISN